MNITYISSFDATDITSYSGTGYFIPHKLGEKGNDIQYIGKLGELNPKTQKAKKRLYKYLGKNYLIERNPKVLNLWNTHINSRITVKPDVQLGYSSQPFAMLKNPFPKAFWADAIFADMIDYYEVYSNLCKESVRDGNLMEKAALENVDMAIFSSEWAANGAVKHYGISKSKTRVLPYGANIDVTHTLNDIERMVKEKDFKVCNLLFLGVEWHRKGGDIAVEIARKLNANGLKTTLSIVGVEPADEIKNLDFVQSYGFIKKSAPDGKKLINNIISQSHFLVLPSRADCTPIVFGEFNAYGIPVITTNEGGIPSIIKNGVNGYMFSKNSDVEVFANQIEALMRSKAKYLELSKSAFNEYKSRLNWDTAINNLNAILNEIRK
jgi:glycosyltransferase involved in cell wall biosynthesis